MSSPAPENQARPKRAVLFAQYARSHGRVGTIIAIIWTIVFIGLIGLLGTFDFVQLKYEHRGVFAIGLTVFVAAILWLLSIVEGSELAVARHLETDPQNLPDSAARIVLARVQKDPKSFFNGRQALVVTSIVALTLSVTQIGRLHRMPFTSADGIIAFLRTWPIQAALVFGFPNFIVLWISQLYPKLRAAGDAPGRFAMKSYQLIVRMCMSLERTTRVGAPTSILGIIRDRVLLTGIAAEATSMKPIELNSQESIHQTG